MEHEASCEIVLTCTMQLSLIKIQRAFQLYTTEWKLKQNWESLRPVRAAMGAGVTQVTLLVTGRAAGTFC